MKKIISGAIILILSLALTHASAEIWAEQRLTNTAWHETGPKFDKVDGTLYYNDFRNGPADVYAWDAATGFRPVIQAPGTQVVDGAYGSTLVYRSYSQEAQGYADLYLYDPVNGTRTISTAPGDQTHAGIFGDTIVWEDHRGPYSQIYTYDPVDGERRISPTNSNQSFPKIWGDTVVFEDFRYGRSDVFRWNPNDGELLLSNYLNAGAAPAIYQDKIVMFFMNDPYSSFDEPGLYEWRPSGGIRRLAEASPSDVWYTDTWGDLVVWQHGIGPSQVEAWDPVHGFTAVNQSYAGFARTPSVYENKVAWIGGNEVFLSTLVPEPPGALMLSGLALCLYAVRRGARALCYQTRRR
jgi:beta propeller repeat protein